MLKIKKGDTVQVMAGKDKGKKGKVISILLEKNRALVEGINTVKKHKRQTKQDQKGGIVSVEMPIAISNLQVFCKRCNRPARAGFLISGDGTKTRVCKICKEAL